MFERLFGRHQEDPEVADRIPPGQYRTLKFPVLHYGSVPRTDLAKWNFKAYGEVESPFTYISVVSRPSGSRKIWWLLASGNLTILSSIDGQYRGPRPLMAPP